MGFAVAGVTVAARTNDTTSAHAVIPVSGAHSTSTPVSVQLRLWPSSAKDDAVSPPTVESHIAARRISLRGRKAPRNLATPAGAHTVTPSCHTYARVVPCLLEQLKHPGSHPSCIAQNLDVIYVITSGSHPCRNGLTLQYFHIWSHIHAESGSDGRHICKVHVKYSTRAARSLAMHVTYHIQNHI